MATLTRTQTYNPSRRQLLFGRTTPWPQANPMETPRLRLGHLVRRAGFGATGPELDRFDAMGYEATVDSLFDFANTPDPIGERLAGLGLDLTKGEDLRRWWLVRMRHTTRPLQEKMVLFLHGLLTSGLGKVQPPLMQQQNELFRARALGSYRDLLVEVSKDPAMLAWLDGNNSRKQRPNENYARELMELFTIGIGNYTEDDVRQAARAFTGWSIPKDTLTPVFNPKTFDDGVKTFMGQTGRFNGEQIIDIILGRREAAEFIARRLWTFFAYPNPEPEVIGPLADVLAGTGYNLGAALRHMFMSAEFSSPRAYRSIIKSPVDLVIGTLRTLGLETDSKGLPALVRQMGQDVLNPPNVAGWPGGPTWLNSSLWLYRANFATGIATRRKGDPGTVVDFSGVLGPNSVASPPALHEHLLRLLLDSHQDEASRATLSAYMSAGDARAWSPASIDRKGRGVLNLFLASPEYQLL